MAVDGGSGRPPAGVERAGFEEGRPAMTPAEHTRLAEFRLELRRCGVSDNAGRDFADLVRTGRASLRKVDDCVFVFCIRGVAFLAGPEVFRRVM
jgi:hypothetical protein